MSQESKLSFQVDEDLINEIERYGKDHDLNKSQVIRKGVKLLLDNERM